MIFYILNVKLQCVCGCFSNTTAQEQQLDCADVLDHNVFILVCYYKKSFCFHSFITKDNHLMLILTNGKAKEHFSLQVGCGLKKSNSGPAHYGNTPCISTKSNQHNKSNSSHWCLSEPMYK